jgi:hypothetical protein
VPRVHSRRNNDSGRRDLIRRGERISDQEFCAKDPQNILHNQFRREKSP